MSRIGLSGHERELLVSDALVAVVDVAIGGGDDLQNVDLSSLYGRENETLARRIRGSALEHLCAAWYYLDGREAPATFAMVDLLDPAKRMILRKYRRISVRLKLHLGGRSTERDQNLATTVDQRLSDMRNLAEFDDLLREWEERQVEAPSRLFAEEVKEENKKEIKKELGEYITIGKELQATLERLGSVVCEALLEEIRGSLQVAKRCLEQFR